MADILGSVSQNHRNKVIEIQKMSPHPHTANKIKK